MSKFIVSSSALLKTLAALAPVIANNPAVPILESFLFAVGEGTLTVTASDPEVSLVAGLRIETGAAGAGYALCVPARLLLDLLKRLPDQPITVSHDDENHQITVKSANGRYRISGEDAGNYPKVPAVGECWRVELPSSSLARAVGKTIFALSTDALRPAMTGVLVQLEAARLTFAATDGHRLVRYRRLDVGCANGAGRNFIVPKKAWALLKSWLPSEAAPVELDFAEGGGHLRIRCQGRELIARLIDERYPDYTNVIPIDTPNKLLVDRRELLDTMHRVGLLANKTTYQVRLALDGAALTATAEDLYFGNEGSETLACQYDGEPLTIGFNTRYLNDCLSNLDTEQLDVALGNPSRAALLVPVGGDAHEDVLMLVMPVMLNHYA